MPCKRIGFIVLLAMASVWSSVQAVQQAFLVQNSGWMEPFYVDAQSAFKPLISAVVMASTVSSDKVTISAFSQSNADQTSPQILWQGTGGNDPSAILQPLGLARKGAALADTDFKEAILNTINQAFQQQPGIIWIFTNNKNSPNNDTQTAQRNSEFYNLLHLQPAISKTLAFPLQMPVKGNHYQANGMMIYALAYGEEASKALDKIVQDSKFRAVLNNPPAQLKPLDQNGIRIIPQKIVDQKSIDVSLGADQKTLILEVNEENFVPSIRLQAQLQNAFYPYTLDAGQLSAHLIVDKKRIPVKISMDTLQQLEPGVDQPVEITVDFPMAQIPSKWSMQAMAAMGKELVIPMVLEIQVNDQKLKVSQVFVRSLKNLFGSDPIADVFTPPSESKNSKTTIPLQLRLQYPLLPIFLIFGSIFSLIFGLAFLARLKSKVHRVTLLVDGVRKPMVIKRFQSVAIKDEYGRQLGVLSKGMKQIRVTAIEKGHDIMIEQQ